MTNSNTDKKRWYAVYTRSRSEKLVNKQLAEKGIDSFLPLRKVLKQWSDRKKWVEEPLFRSYIFVYIDPRLTLPVLEVFGVVGFIKFEKQLVAIPEKQIESVKILLNSEEKYEVSNKPFVHGMEVEVISGPLKGAIGVVQKYKGKFNLMIAIEAVNQVLMATVPEHVLKKIS